MRTRDGLLTAADRADDYRRVRSTTESLTARLDPEDCMVQSMSDASPAKWHLAHTTWFFETFVVVSALPEARPAAPAFRDLFNSYYRAVGEPFPRAGRAWISRPTLREVLAYRARIDEAMARVLDLVDAERPDLAGAIELGLHHEQQHQELILTDIKHAFSQNPLEPAYLEPLAVTTGTVSNDEWVAYRGGDVEIGHGGGGFCFDNEQPRHVRRVDPFELAVSPVTCGEYARFVEDGGYDRPDLWLADGWDAKAREGWRAPLYWRKDGAVWTLFTLRGRREMNPIEPVAHVSFYEAEAYARWAGARLPREDEWEHAASGRVTDGNSLDRGQLQPVAGGAADPGPRQMFGDVWEWTASAYLPYPGYRPPPGALGEYNGKFMCNRMVLRGGSCVTPAGHVRATYRNYFGPAARWQFSGLRLARS